MAERLAARHEVDVLTTCARDYVTWRNEYPEGSDRIRGVTVRRFVNAQTRDIAAFNRYSDWIFNNPHDAADEMEWLKQQGPWSPALVDYIKRTQKNYDTLIFYTYLYAPTVLGIQIEPRKSILVPFSIARLCARCDVQAPPSGSRSVCPVRRPHRSRKRLRGAHRIFQHLRAGGRRRRTCADGLETDAAAGGALHQFRRPPVRAGAAPGPRSGYRSRCTVAVREPFAARARSARGGHPDSLQCAQRRA